MLIDAEDLIRCIQESIEKKYVLGCSFQRDTTVEVMYVIDPDKLILELEKFT